MGLLVLIPHHYLGFFYVMFCLLLFMMLPWFDDGTNINLPHYISEYLQIRFGMDLNLNNSYLFFTLVFLTSYTTLVVPTGRYFVQVGGSEILVFSFWFIVMAFVFINRGAILVLVLFYYYNT